MAEVLIWSPEMSVGNAEIDIQHRKLLDTANMVGELSGTDDHEVILAALDEVAEYALMHFSFEEALLQHSGFAGFDGHKGQHDVIRECVHTIVRNRELVTADMLNDVMTRLIRHILTVDREYAGHVAGGSTT